jgi:hypothetical protein
MTDWKKVYAASREHIRAQAVSGMFVAAVYAVIGILGLALLVSNRPMEIPLGVLFVGIGVLGGGYFGLQAYREYIGDPIILVTRVLGKQEMLSYSRTGAVRRYVLRVEISKAFSVDASGEQVDVPAKRWDVIPVGHAIYSAVGEGANVSLVCTAAGVAFAILDDLV